MQAGENKKGTNVAYTLAVKLQFCDSHALDRRQGNETRKLIIPRKMLVPGMYTRMVQGCNTLAGCIIRLGLVLFVAIAPHTRKGEVVRDGLPTFRNRENVFGDKGINAELCRAATVFAAPVGTAGNLRAQSPRYILRQRREP